MYLIYFTISQIAILVFNLLAAFLAYDGYVSDAMDAGIELQMLQHPGVRLMYEMYLRSDVVRTANVRPIRSAQMPEKISTKGGSIVLQFNADLEATRQPDGDLLFCINPLLDLLNTMPCAGGLTGGDLIGPIAAAEKVDGGDDATVVSGAAADGLCGAAAERLNVDVMVSLMPGRNQRLGMYVMPWVGAVRRVTPYVVWLERLRPDVADDERCGGGGSIV